MITREESRMRMRMEGLGHAAVEGKRRSSGHIAAGAALAEGSPPPGRPHRIVVDDLQLPRVAAHVAIAGARFRRPVILTQVFCLAPDAKILEHRRHEAPEAHGALFASPAEDHDGERPRVERVFSRGLCDLVTTRR